MGVIGKTDLFLKSPYAGWKILEAFFNERLFQVGRNALDFLNTKYFTIGLDDFFDIEGYINGLSRDYYNPKTWELFSGTEDVCNYLGIENIPAEKYFSQKLSVDWLYNKLQILDALRYLDVEEVFGGVGNWRAKGGGETFDELYNSVNGNITQSLGSPGDLNSTLSYIVKGFLSFSADLVVFPCYIYPDEDVRPDRKDILLKSEIVLHYERTSYGFIFNDLGYDFVQEDGFVCKTKINETGMFPVFANPPQIPYVTKTGGYGRTYTFKYGYVDIHPFMQYTTTP